MTVAARGGADGGCVVDRSGAAHAGAASAGRRIVLNFHGIGDPHPDVPGDEHPFWCPRDEWPVLVEAVAAAARSGSLVGVTFDDGNDSDVEDALPALLEHGLTATFHVCVGRLGQRGYLDEDAVRHLRDAGMSIGSHGWDHVDLRSLAERDLVRATRDSRQLLGELCGTPVTQFAVPFGSYDRRALAHLRDYGTVYTSDGTTWTAGSGSFRAGPMSVDGPPTPSATSLRATSPSGTGCGSGPLCR